MWTAIQLTVCAIFLAIVAYWVGRFFGKRKYLKLHEEMRALELSFNQLIDEMELASNHNMKVIEKQSEELSELLTIADQKILRVNDFLKELDETAANVKRKNNFNHGNVEQSDFQIERRLRQEFNNAFEEIHLQIREFSAKLQQTEARPLPEPAEIDPDQLKTLVEEEVSRQISRQLSFLEAQLEPPPAEKIVPMRATPRDFGTRFVAPPPPNNEPEKMPLSVGGLKTANIDSQAKLPPRKADLGPEPKTIIPELSPGSPVHEVLRLAESGVTLPQIARNMSMGKGEIELILKIYGGRINMRSVV